MAIKTKTVNRNGYINRVYLVSGGKMAIEISTTVEGSKHTTYEEIRVLVPDWDAKYLAEMLRDVVLEKMAERWRQLDEALKGE